MKAFGMGDTFSCRDGGSVFCCFRWEGKEQTGEKR
jgi:hypothetical protein